MNNESALIIATGQIVSALIKSDRLDLVKVDDIIEPRNLETIITVVKEDLMRTFNNN